ncbi:hypothetical protein RYA05_03935 [Pseudomonas syringae pv. actinidiae]|nr:hypothetical protein [Pseudomonas syringae pv. actinidiae]
MLLSCKFYDSGDIERESDSISDFKVLFVDADGLVEYADITDEHGNVVWQWPDPWPVS